VFRIEARILFPILRLESTHDPALSFHNGKSQGDNDPTAILTAALLQTIPSLWLIVLVPDQYDSVQAW
jgi:hypothetical protein